jgi:hypothetical protein
MFGNDQVVAVAFHLVEKAQTLGLEFADGEAGFLHTLMVS